MIKSYKNFQQRETTLTLQSELEHKLLLLRRLCLVAIAAQVGGISTFLFLILQTGQQLLWLAPLTSVLVILFYVVSYKLVNNFRYYQSSWVLVLSTIAGIMVYYWLVGTQVPVPVAFMIPIILASVLMKTWQAILVAAITIVYSAGLYVCHIFLQIYSPPVTFSSQIQTIISLAIILVIIPMVVALFIVPTRSLFRVIRMQNDRLQGDLLEIQKVKTEVQQSEANLKAIFNNSLQAYILLDSDKRIQAFNKQADDIAAEVFGRPVEINANMPDVIKNLDKALFEENLNTALKGNLVRCEVKVKVALTATITHDNRPGTSWYDLRFCPVITSNQQVTGVCISLLNIDQRKKAEAILEKAALHDPLTGLPNRTLFLRRLEAASSRVSRSHSNGFAVLFIDLDRFKLINDSLGHIFGDLLLIGIARRLESCLRPEDTVARLGGDEFTILLEDMNIQQNYLVTTLAARIIETLRQPFWLNEQEVSTSASIGIALSTAGPELPEELLRKADTAMYEAKARGKGCFQLYNTVIHEQV